MLRKIPTDRLLFLDIETVPEARNFSDLDEETREMWADKSRYRRGEQYTAEEFYSHAGIWAEFGRIVCISVGYLVLRGNQRNFRVTTFYGEERELLIQFKQMLEAHFSGPQHLLCAHNGKEFDFPYIARRMIIHSIPLPGKLDLFGKKPWEVPHLDTMELWKFGDYKHYTSLKLMAKILGIPSPKGDIDGSMVRDVFYEDEDLERIIKYCELDVVTLAQVFLRLRNDPVLESDEILRI